LAVFSAAAITYCRAARDGQPLCFQKQINIRVQGILNESWSERLGGLRITAGRVDDQGRTVTELFGKVRDQAALAGLLNSLYELHMTLLSVEYISEE
jgi:hypothetical protein